MTLPLPVPFVENFPDVQQNLDHIAMQFPLAAANLADKAATGRKVKLDVVTKTATGTNGFVINAPNWSNLFWMDYTTPAVTMQGIIIYTCRLNDQIAAWNWSRSGIALTAGTGISSIAPWTLLNTFGGAGNPIYAQHVGWAYLQLSASTTYQFAVQAHANAVNTMLWVPLGPEANAMTGIFWAL